MGSPRLDQLLCRETVIFEPQSVLPSTSSSTCSSILDPALVEDERVLANLLEVESRYMPSCSYFQCIQMEVRPAMRNVLAYWMAEVCEENRCQDDVLPLAMNLLDRFLSVANVRKQHLQLLGAVCLFISSKLREAVPLCAQLLSRCTDYSTSCSEIVEWEVLVLQKLRWEASSITSYDFLNPLMHRLPLRVYFQEKGVEEVRRISQTFIVMCATDYKFSMFPASMIASASIVAAVHSRIERSSSSQVTDRLLRELRSLTCIEIDLLKNCWKQIEDLVTELAAEHQSVVGNNEQHQSSTPTEILNVDF